MNIKLPQTTKDRAIAAGAIALLLSLVGGVALSLYQVDHNPVSDSYRQAADEAEQLANESHQRSRIK